MSDPAVDVFGEEPSPLAERPVAGHAEGAASVGGGDEAEQQLGAGVVDVHLEGLILMNVRRLFSPRGAGPWPARRYRWTPRV